MVFRILAASLLLAAVAGLGSYRALRTLEESSTHEVRRQMYLYTAERIESGPYAETIQPPEPRPRPDGRPRRPPAPPASLWVVSEDGQVLASYGGVPLPVPWAELPKPTVVHDFALHYRTLGMLPDLGVVKLESPAGNDFLVLEIRHRGGGASTGLWIQAALILFVVLLSFLTAMVLLYFYLRQKSREARAVLGRLESGDLKARFEIKQFDSIGHLMTDFNRMAAEIERLVGRVEQTELARKALLEELSHDLRTPLTSLKTSIDTLWEHADVMTPEDRREFLAVCRAELAYFLSLIDDLFFISDLGEPRYKSAAQRINLRPLLEEELRARQAQERAEGAEGKMIRWISNAEDLTAESASLVGDELQIRRLFKNVLDNAGRHARSEVAIRVGAGHSPGSLVVRVENDGDAISDEDIATFGERKKNRVRPARAGPLGNRRPSLGLGSVIMRAIIELHGGTLEVGRVAPSSGTRVVLSFPAP